MSCTYNHGRLGSSAIIMVARGSARAKIGESVVERFSQTASYDEEGSQRLRKAVQCVAVATPIRFRFELSSRRSARGKLMV